MPSIDEQNYRLKRTNWINDIVSFNEDLHNIESTGWEERVIIMETEVTLMYIVSPLQIKHNRICLILLCLCCLLLTGCKEEMPRSPLTDHYDSIGNSARAFLDYADYVKDFQGENVEVKIGEAVHALNKNGVDCYYLKVMIAPKYYEPCKIKILKLRVEKPSLIERELLSYYNGISGLENYSITIETLEDIGYIELKLCICNTGDGYREKNELMLDNENLQRFINRLKLILRYNGQKESIELGNIQFTEYASLKEEDRICLDNPDEVVRNYCGQYYICDLFNSRY